MADVKVPRASASQRRAERMAERMDAWRCANNLVRSAHDWDEGISPYDVLQLAQWLAGGATD